MNLSHHKNLMIVEKLNAGEDHLLPNTIISKIAEHNISDHRFFLLRSDFLNSHKDKDRASSPVSQHIFDKVARGLSRLFIEELEEN